MNRINRTHFQPSTTVASRKQRASTKTKKDSGATTGYEAQLWAMADALRGSMDASEHKHVVLGLIFTA